MRYARRASQWWRGFEDRRQAPLVDRAQPRILRYAQRASQWWHGFEDRRQAPLVDRVQPHISGARRLAYLLYGDWLAADEALGRAVRRLVAPWRRWWHRGVDIDTLLGDALVSRYVVERGARVDGWRRWRPRRRPRITSARTDAVAQPLLLATLEDLTARQRAVLVCRHYRGMDPAVTASVLGGSTVDVTADLMAASGIVITAIDRQHAGTGPARPVVVLTGEVVEEGGAADDRR